MANLRTIDMPPHLESIPEVAEVDRVSDVFVSQWYDDIDGIHEDLLITTASERGIARREAILGITPPASDTLDARRARVMMRWYDRTPYTRAVIERKIRNICGEGNYEFTYNAETMYLDVLLKDVEDDVLRAISESLEEMVMLMVVLNVRNGKHGEATVYKYLGLLSNGFCEHAPVITIKDPLYAEGEAEVEFNLGLLSNGIYEQATTIST